MTVNGQCLGNVEKFWSYRVGELQRFASALNNTELCTLKCEFYGMYIISPFESLIKK